MQNVSQLILPAIKTVSNKTFHAVSKFLINITATHLFYELGLYDEKNSMETWEYFEKWTL